MRALFTRRYAALTMLMIAGVALCLFAGRWQWSKHVDRDLEIASIESGTQSQPEPIDQVLNVDQAVEGDSLYRLVTATGTYDADRQLIVRFRPLNGQPGAHVLTPLTVDGGATVLVDRGFIVGNGSSVIALPPPSGQVSIIGRVREPEAGAGTGGAPSDGAIRFLDVPTLSAWLDTPTYANHVELVAQDPAPPAELLLLPEPEVDPGPYFSYGIQWYLFAIAAIAGWVALGYRDIKDARANEPVTASST